MNAKSFVTGRSRDPGAILQPLDEELQNGSKWNGIACITEANPVDVMFQDSPEPFYTWKKHKWIQMITVRQQCFQSVW